MVTECVKNFFALIGDSVGKLYEIMRLICYGQIFNICRAWTRKSSHEEQVACSLERKVHFH